MKRTVLAKHFGLGIVLSTSLLGCATEPTDVEEECLPGDIDCAPDDGGKADSFGTGANDPQ